MQVKVYDTKYVTLCTSVRHDLLERVAKYSVFSSHVADV